MVAADYPLGVFLYTEAGYENLRQTGCEAGKRSWQNTHAVTVDHLGNMAFRAITETGHEIIMDVTPEVGGTDTGPRPMELLLVGLHR